MIEALPRVLIVDDDVKVGEAVQHALVHAGFAVERLDTGFGVLVVARRWRPDIILLDLGMPGLDGEAVHRVLRTFADRGLSRIPVVFWSGRVQGELDAIASRTQSIAISKQMPIRDLIAKLRSIITPSGAMAKAKEAS